MHGQNTLGKIPSKAPLGLSLYGQADRVQKSETLPFKLTSNKAPAGREQTLQALHSFAQVTCGSLTCTSSLNHVFCAQVPCVTYFDAQLQILDLLEHKAIFTAGYKAILHLHSLVEECEITRLLAQVNTKTKEKTRVRLSPSLS